jgi:NTE family protein
VPDAATRRAIARAASFLLALVLGGCQWVAPDVPVERAPRFEPPAAPPRVALVLGSGGPRGFAHIGVMKVLEENGIRPDFIIGCSVGAMVGALSASGLRAVELEQLSEKIKVAEFFELGMIGVGKASGAATQNYVNAHVGGRTIEQLRIHFAAAATRLGDGKLVLFTKGDTGLAVRASSANPDSFKPVKIGDDQYVDGDMASPVPIRAARSLGAKVVIAVDVSAYVEDTPPNAPRSWVEGDARRSKLIVAEAPLADVMLHPNIGYYAGHGDEYRRRVIGLAEAYTRKQIPAIKAALSRAGMPQATGTERMPSGVASR